MESELLSQVFAGIFKHFKDSEAAIVDVWLSNM